MYTDKKYLPKKLIAKGNRLFGNKKKDAWGIEVDAWTIDYNYETITLVVASNDVATVELAEIPGCCGVVVITDLRTDGEEKQGYGKFLAEAALYIGANNGYTLAIATTVFKNKPSNKIAEALKAGQAAAFTNRKTKNVVKVWVKHLPPKHKDLPKW